MSVTIMGQFFQRFKQLHRSFRYGIYSLCLIGLYSLLGFFVLPWWAINYAPALISDQLNGRVVTVKDIQFNPFELSLAITHLHISQATVVSSKGSNEHITGELITAESKPAEDVKPHHTAALVSVNAIEFKEPAQQPLLGFDYLRVNFQSISLFTGVFTFDELTLIKPYGHISILENNALNIQDLLPVEEASSTLSEGVQSNDLTPEQALPQLLVHQLLIDRANIHFNDLTKATPFQAEVGPLTINLSNFTTEREKNSPYKLKAESGGGVIGSNLEWEGYLSINPLKSTGQLSISDVNLNKLASYVREQFEFEIQEGLLDLDGSYVFDYSGETPLLDVQQGHVNITDLRIGHKAKEETLLSFPSIRLNTIEYSLEKEFLTIDHLKITDGDYSVKLNKQGHLNLESLFVSQSGEQVVPAHEQAIEPIIEAETLEVEQSTQESNFRFNLAHLELANNAIRVFDLSPKKPMGIDFSDLNLNLRNLNLVDNNLMTLDLAGRLGKGDEKGRLNLSGEIIAFPQQQLNLKVDLDKQPLKHFEPYLREFALIKVRSGYADITGRLMVDIEPEVAPKVNFSGDVNVANVLLTENDVRKKLLNFKQLSIRALQADTEKHTFKAKSLSLNTPKFWLDLNKQGHLNFQRIVHASAEEESSSRSSSASPVLRLGQLNLNNAQVYYEDYSVDPLFSLSVTQLTGKIKKLSTQNNSKADIDLNGMIDDYAPLHFNGKLNLLSEEIYSDIMLDIKNLNMTSFTTYSGIYAGRKIDKGQLNLAVSYQVEKNQLSADNAVFIDQFNFGEKVDSEQATNLPVGLGVSLLKNQKGEIHIDMPIEGDLSDPDFRYGKLVWKTLGNVLLKAAASPFKLLAGLVDSEDDLSQVSFSASSVLLSDEAIQKLSSLESALIKRPDLNLDIEACFNTAFDSPIIQLSQIQARINPENKVLSQSNYKRLLAADYQKNQGVKPIYPTYTEGMDKDAKRIQDIHFLESELIKQEPISSQQLQALAIERRAAIQSQLLASNRITASRLFAIAIEEKPLVDGAIACHLTIQ